MSDEHLTQLKLEQTTCLRYVVNIIKAEFLEKVEVPHEYRHLLAELYIHDTMDTTHVLGSWFKSHGVEMDLEKFISSDCAIYHEKAGTFESRWQMSAAHQKMLLGTYKSDLPMIEPPRDIWNNRSNGRHLANEHCTCGSPLARHDGDICLDVFNMLSQQPWKLQETFKGTSKNLHGKPDFDSTQEQLRKFYGDEPVWFTWTADSRGRMYARNYWFNPQGCDAGKASIKLPEARHLDERGIHWLWIDLGTSLGLDKKSFEDRKIEAMEAYTKGYAYMLETYEPEDVNIFAQCYLAVQKLLAGEPVDHMVSLDATASGLQVSSTLMCDLETMKMTNIIDSGERLDAYTELYRIMMETYPDDESLNGILRGDMKRAIMTGNYGSTKTPKDIFGGNIEKFNSTMDKHCWGPQYVNKTLQALWQEDFEFHEWNMPDGFHVKIPSRDTQNRTNKSAYGMFTYGVEVLVPGTKRRGMAANTIHSLDAFVLREIVRMCNTLPDTIEYVRGILLKPVKAHKEPSEDAQRVHKCWVDTGIVSVRMLHILEREPEYVHLLNEQEVTDLLNLVDHLRGNYVQLLTVHDCFRVHPNDADDVTHYYRVVLSNICRGNFLQYMVKTFIPKKEIVIPTKEVRDAFADEILKSTHAIC